MQLKNGKRGIILISYILLIFSIVMILYIFAFVIFKFQVTTKILSIRKDLFYISQNSVMALDKELLSYNEYNMDKHMLEELITKLIKNNYGNKVQLRNVEYNYKTNEITIEIDLLIKPIFSFGIIKEQKISLKETSKLKLMEVD